MTSLNTIMERNTADPLYDTVVEKYKVYRQLKKDDAEIFRDLHGHEDVMSVFDLSLTVHLFFSAVEILKYFSYKTAIRLKFASREFFNKIDPCLTQDRGLQLKYVELTIRILNVPDELLPIQIYPEYRELLEDITQLMEKENLTLPELKTLYDLLVKYESFKIHKADIDNVNDALLYMQYTLSYIDNESITAEYINKINYDTFVKVVYGAWDFYKKCKTEVYQALCEDENEE